MTAVITRPPTPASRHEPSAPESVPSAREVHEPLVPDFGATEGDPALSAALQAYFQNVAAQRTWPTEALVGDAMRGFEQQLIETLAVWREASGRWTAAFQTGQPTARRSTEELARVFASEVARHPWVTQVLIDESQPDRPCIWTVIRATPFEYEFRGPIYQAQLNATDSVPDANVHFRLINLNELDQEPATVLPAEYRVAFERDRSA